MKSFAQIFGKSSPFAGVLLVCVALYSSGCRSIKATVEVHQPPDASLSKYENVTVEVVSKDPDFTVEESGQLSDDIVNGLRKVARFQSVNPASASLNKSADLKVSIVIRLAVSPTTHGQQSVETSIILMDALSEKTLATASANSGTGAGLIGVKTSKVISKLADQIVDFIRSE
jgi:hypothetical protein